MADIDKFAASLLEESKRFLEKASADREGYGETAYLHAAVLLAFCSLEAHVNAVIEDFIGRAELSLHERGFLLENEVSLEKGEFVLGGLRISRLEDRILFLHRKFSGAALDKSATWWSDLANAVVVRNKLTHPKQAQEISIASVQRAVTAIIETIDALYQGIYKRAFPAAKLGLQSQMDF